MIVTFQTPGCHISPKENYAFIRYLLREDFQPLSKYTIPTVPFFGVVFVLKTKSTSVFGLPYQADMCHSTGAWWHWHGRNGVLEPKILPVSHKVPSLSQVFFEAFFEDANILYIYMMSTYYRSGAYKMIQGKTFHRGTTYSFHRGTVKGD